MPFPRFVSFLLLLPFLKTKLTRSSLAESDKKSSSTFFSNFSPSDFPKERFGRVNNPTRPLPPPPPSPSTPPYRSPPSSEPPSFGLHSLISTSSNPCSPPSSPSPISLPRSPPPTPPPGISSPSTKTANRPSRVYRQGLRSERLDGIDTAKSRKATSLGLFWRRWRRSGRRLERAVRLRLESSCVVRCAFVGRGGKFVCTNNAFRPFSFFSLFPPLRLRLHGSSSASSLFADTEGLLTMSTAKGGGGPPQPTGDVVGSSREAKFTQLRQCCLLPPPHPLPLLLLLRRSRRRFGRPVLPLRTFLSSLLSAGRVRSPFSILLYLC